MILNSHCLTFNWGPLYKIQTVIFAAKILFQMAWGESRHQNILTVPLNVSNFHPGLETSGSDIIKYYLPTKDYRYLSLEPINSIKSIY